MNAFSDAELLRQFAETHSEEAFAELVRRHIDLVYSAAVRMVCDSHLAQDVTQGTFLALSRSAPQLKDCAFLSSWLHRTAQNISAQTVRTEVRRRAREEKASIMNEVMAEEPEAQWNEVAPHLDAALGELNEQDRGVVLQRYFERKTAREISVTLGVSEDAAQRRVARAVQRLRDFFAKRGVTVGTGGIVALVSVNAVQAAPVGLAASVTAAIALAGTAGAATSATFATFKIMAITSLKSVLITGTVIGVSVALFVQHRQLERLTAEREKLLAENQKKELALATLSKSSGLLKTSEDESRIAELGKLRTEAVRLRALEAEVMKARQEASKQEAGRSGLAADASKEEVLAQFEAVVVTHVNAFKHVGLKLRLMDLYKELSEAFGPDGNLSPTLLSKEVPNFDLTQVEIVLPDPSSYRKVTDEEPETIIARSRQPIANPDGTWTRIYLLADGSVQRKSTPMPNQAYDGKWQLRTVN